MRLETGWRARGRAGALHHPVCDCLCLELAASLGIPLVTGDRRLLALADPRAAVLALDAVA